MNLLELGDPRWLDFVGSRPDATLFHHPAWARLLCDCYGYRATVAALTDGGAITAGAPAIDVSRRLGRRRWISLPFTDYCPPLADEGPGQLVAGLPELAKSRNLHALEIRAEIPDGAAVRRRTGFVRHELTLPPDAGLVWDRISKNHRRNVRTAERLGIRIVRGTSASDVETFYRLHLQTRRRLGVPIQPRRFFRLLLERILGSGLGFVLSAYSGEIPVAAAIFGTWNGTLIYKYGARDDRFAKLGANHLLFWTAIQSAIETRHRTFDFGRSDEEQVSLRAFKDGWGAREISLSYSSITTAPARVEPSSRGLGDAMALVIRHSSPWVCRAVGELFYRYSA
jgi:CelD/BcsL family acetyltransferase involved in cellulose biosynthesis